MSPLPRDDGIHVRVEGLGQPFRFRLGLGTVSRARSDSVFLWRIEGDVGAYRVQLIPHTLVEGLSAEDLSAEPIIILNSYFHWEASFMRETLGLTVDESDIRMMKHPAGTPLLTWISRNPEPELPAKQVNAIPAEEVFGHSSSSPQQYLTPFGAHAMLLHQPDHLLYFAMTGLDVSWNEEELQWQVLRVAMSYFPLEEA